jgi:LemA protein
VSTTTFPSPTPTRNRLPRWAIPVGIGVALLLFLVMPVVGAYNRLTGLDNDVERQYGQVEVQQQRRFDLIPNLVAATQAVLTQEKEIFEDITEARARYAGAQRSGNVDEQVAASENLESSLGRLLVIVENNPALRSSETVKDLMVQLEGTENRIAQERGNYNEVVSDYNLAVRRFPGSIAAGLFGFDRKPVFKGKVGSEDVPKVDLNTSDG